MNAKEFLENKYFNNPFFEEEINKTNDPINLVADLMEEWQQLHIADVMAMLPIIDLSKVNRVEVIDENGRSYVNWKPTNKTSISMQDDGKTLKVFIGN